MNQVLRRSQRRKTLTTPTDSGDRRGSASASASASAGTRRKRGCGVRVSRRVHQPDIVILDEDNEKEEGAGEEPSNGSDRSGVQQPDMDEGNSTGENCGREREEIIERNNEGEETNVEVKRETEEIPIDAVNCAREGEGKEAVLEVPSEEDELEITGVKESVTMKPKKMPVVSCVAWRTRLSRGKQERVSYSTYFQKISDDSGEEKDDDKRDKDAIEEEEEEEEESSSSEEELDRSEPDLDDDMLIGEWQERYRSVKRKIMESEEERDETGFLGSELDGFMPEPPAKKMRPDNLEEVHVIESDLEADLEPDRGVLRSASSDSDWEEEIRNVPSTGGGSGVTGLGIASDGIRKYHLQTPGSKSYPRLYRQNITKDGSCSKSRSYKRCKRRSFTKGRGPRGQELMRMLVDRMCGGNVSGNWMGDPNQYGLKDLLPMVFCFEEEEEEREKLKSKEDRELDALWADYEFALESENIGRYHNDEVLA